MSEGMSSKCNDSSITNDSKDTSDGTTRQQTVSKTTKSVEGKSQRVKDSDTKEPRVRLPANMEPTFYIGGGNGVALVEEICTSMGWKRTLDKRDDNFRFKWCELKSSINYYNFKEGDQMVNHIPNCNLLTNKLGLLNSLQDYDRMCQAVGKRSAKLDFIPETYRLDDMRDRTEFRNIYTDGEMWICKPTGRNQGKGIFIVKNQDEVNKIFEDQEGRTQDGRPQRPLNRVIQRYLNRPLLLNKKKFDIRCYMLIASTVPYLVLYHKGYIRLSIHDYDNNTDNLIAHLTNQFIQKKDPTYKDVKDETTWSMERFNEYVNETYMNDKGLEQDWVLNELPARIKQIMTYCFNCVKTRLQCKIGYHDLYGFDFMIDEDMKVWLIEVNVNPCLATNCEALKEVVPEVVNETIHVVNECFEKARKGRALLPLDTVRGFEMIYSQGSKSPRKVMTSSPYRKDMVSRAAMQRVMSSNSPTRRSNAAPSPVKEPTIVAPSMEGDVQQVAKSGAQYPLNRQGTRSNVARVKNTPTATPTIITPGNELPQTARSNTFAQLRGAGPPSNAAINSKYSQNGTGGIQVSLAVSATTRDVVQVGKTSQAKSSSDNPKSSSAVSTTSVKSTPTQGKQEPVHSGKSKGSLAPLKETSEPPHHQKIKKDLKNKVTSSTETLIIRNMTKSRRSDYQTKPNKNAASNEKQVLKVQTPTPPQKGTHQSFAKIMPPRADNKTPMDQGDYDDEAPSSEYGDDYSNEQTDDEQTQPSTNTNESNNIDSIAATESVTSPRENIASKKITLHMTPHGFRGNKDGGKPAMSLQYAALYPTSPYVDSVPVSIPVGHATVAQLRMTHNGVLPRPKQFSNVVEHEKPNRGS